MTRPAWLSSTSPKLLAILFSIVLSACGGGSDTGSASSGTSGATGTGSNSNGSNLTPSTPAASTQSNSEALAPTPSSTVSPTQPPATASNGSTTPAGTTTTGIAQQPTPTGEPAWTIAELSGLVAGNVIKDMNDAGAIVGVTVDPNETPVHGRIPYQDPFIVKNGQATSLGTLGGSYGSANDINGAGQIAGYSYVSSVGQTHAFLYENGTMKDIGIFFGSGGSWAEAINESGQVAVYTNTGTYIYDRGNVRAIPGAQFLPASLNDSGQMAGTLLNSGAAGFYDGTTIVNLGAMLPKAYSLAVGVNNAGQVIGMNYGATGADYQAFLYSGGVMQPLVAPNSIESHAGAINNAGDVVGEIENADHTWRAFLYRNGTMTDLNTLPGVAGSGWVLTSATKINNAGQIIARGYFNGQARYCVLTPPR